MLWLLTTALASPWPALDKPPRVGGGDNDTAVVVAIDDYFAVPDVPGAEANGAAWFDWFVDGRQVPVERVRWLRGGEATAENVLQAATELGQLTGADGTAWLVFVGHGAAATDGDPLLLGVDVQATASSLQERGVRRSELVASLGAGGAAPVLVLDSCFSGQTPGGDPLVAGLQPVVPTWVSPAGGVDATVLTAGTGQQVAGPLPGAAQPAFSYLVLGALQGWGDADGDGTVTATEATVWAQQALATTLVGREQVPGQQGPDRPLAASGGRRAPDLAEVVRGRRPEAAAPLPPVPGPIDLSQVKSLKVEQALAEARAVEEDRRSTPSEVADSWCGAARQLDGNRWQAAAQASCDGWTARAKADATQRGGFRTAYNALDDYLRTDGIDADRKASAARVFVQTWEPAFPDDWYLRRVERAAGRLEQRGRGRVPPLGSHLKSVSPWADQGPFFKTWSNATVNHGVVPLRLGVAGEDDGSLGVNAQAMSGFTIGPLDVALLNVTGMVDGGLITAGFQAGFVPFTWRPSKRTHGELRGSLLNPIVGLGYRVGAAAEGGDKASYIEAYAANQLFFTNVVGLRVEGRLPLASTAGDTPTSEVPITWVVAPVINIMGRR